MSRNFKGPGYVPEDNNDTLDNSDDDDFPDEEESRLFVGNVPVEMCDKVTLYNMFMSEGQVKEVYCHPPQPGAYKSWAMVTYFSKRDAVRAIKAFQKKPPHYLRIEFAKEKNNTSSGKKEKSLFDAFDGEHTHRKNKQTDFKHAPLKTTMESADPGYEPTSPPRKSFSPKQESTGSIYYPAKSKHSFTSRCESDHSGSENRKETDRQSLFMKSPLQEQEVLPENIFTKVVVVYPNGPFEYWVVLESNYTLLAFLSKELSKYANSPGNFIPSVGQYCMAKFEDVWFRGKILSVKPQIKVFYIDFGNETIVHLEDLRELPDTVKDSKSQAILLRLTPGTSKKFENLPEQSELIVKVIGKQEGSYIVSIKGEESSEIIPEPVPEIEELPSIDLEEGFCLITAALENEIYVRPAQKNVLKMLVLIQSELMIHCNTSKPLGREPELGELLAAKFSDGNFYRAIVLDVKHHSGIKVQYIDFGNLEYVKRENLKPLNENLLSHVCLAVKVEIKKLVSNFLPDDARQMLEKYVLEESILNLQINYNEDGIVFIRAPDLTVVGKVNSASDPEIENIPDGRILTMQDIRLEKWIEKSVVEILIHEVLDYNCVSASLANSSVQEALNGKFKVLMNDYCKGEKPYYKPEEGELCLTIIEDNAHRCYCKCQGEDSSLLMLLDTRESVKVSHDYIRKMPKNFIRIPMAGIECFIEMKEDLSRKDKWAAIGYLLRNKKLEVHVLASDGYGYRVRVPVIDQLLNE